MIEIIVLIFLCKKNVEYAREKGRSKGGTIAYTLGLWFAFEFFGVIIGALIGGGLGIGESGITFFVLLIGLLFAGIGGFLSRVIAKNSSPKQGGYIVPPPIPNAQDNLSSPCKIILTFDPEAYAVETDFFLNQDPIGSLRMGESLVTKTFKKQNILTAIKAGGTISANPFKFDVPDAGVVEISFTGKEFVPIKTTVNEVVKTTSNTNKLCQYCGTQLPEDAKFCGACGREL